MDELESERMNKYMNAQGYSGKFFGEAFRIHGNCNCKDCRPNNTEKVVNSMRNESKPKEVTSEDVEKARQKAMEAFAKVGKEFEGVD